MPPDELHSLSASCAMGMRLVAVLRSLRLLRDSRCGKGVINTRASAGDSCGRASSIGATLRSPYAATNIAQGILGGLHRLHISLMKIAVCVSNAMTTPKAYQLETEDNGALAMACQRAQPYVAAARAMSTRRLYARAFKRWAAWCEVMHASPLPASPEAVAAYLAELASDGKSVATVKGALAALRFFHREAGQALEREHRAIPAVMAGIARRASRPIKRAAALELEDLRRLVSGIDGKDLRSLRDVKSLCIARPTPDSARPSRRAPAGNVGGRTHASLRL
jgi:hypothetical protein